MGDVADKPAIKRWGSEPAISERVSVQSPDLIVMRFDVMLALQRGGEVLPWIGPALRGILAARLKALVCRYDAEERRRRWQRCTGCPHLNECPYGHIYETECPHGAATRHGQMDAQRRVVVAPFFPIEHHVAAGDVIGTRVTLIGERAVKAMPHVVAALTSCGVNPGLGPDHIMFRMHRPETAPESVTVHARDLPGRVAVDGGVVPRLSIVLDAPLCLHRRDRSGMRRTLFHPTLGELFRACSRTLSSLFAQQGDRLHADFAALVAAAERVRTREDHYERFSQRRWSTRTEQRFSVQGATGGAVYENVPLALLPWLLWGGRLHVGTHRVAGAGGWRLLLD